MHQQITEKVVIYCLLALLFVCVWINLVVHKVLSNFYLRTWIFSIICAKYSFLCFNLQVLLTMDTSILVFQLVYWNVSTQVIPNADYWAKWYTALAPTLIKHTWTSLSKAISEIAPIPSFTVPYIRPLQTLVVEEWSRLELNSAGKWTSTARVDNPCLLFYDENIQRDIKILTVQTHNNAHYINMLVIPSSQLVLKWDLLIHSWKWVYPLLAIFRGSQKRFRLDCLDAWIACI